MDTKVSKSKDKIEGSELSLAYKQFACQIISSSYEMLKSWSMPHSQYTKAQKTQLMSETDSFDIINLYYFFIPEPGNEQISGIAQIIATFELDLSFRPFEVKTKPLFMDAFKQINLYRKSCGLERIKPPFKPE